MQKQGRGANLLKRALQLSSIPHFQQSSQVLNETSIHTTPNLDTQGSVASDFSNNHGNVGDGEPVSPSISQYLLIHDTDECILNEKTGEIQYSNLVLSERSNNTIPDSEKIQEIIESDVCDDDDDDAYEPDGNESSTEGSENLNANKRRGIKRTRYRSKQQKRRMLGKSYNGLKKIDGHWIQSNFRRARQMKDACNCKSAKLKCRKFSDEARKNIHENFWQNLNWEQRTVYVASLVVQIEPTTRRQNIECWRRNFTLKYHLRHNGDRLPVCKKMFLNTLDLGEKCARSWCTRSQNGIPTPSTSRSTLNNAQVDRDTHIQSFLRNLAKMESHYCRANSTKIFLEPNWDSLTDLHYNYKLIAEKDNIKPYSWTHFSQELKKQNITLFQNRKDQCDTCFAFHESRLDKDKYELHLLRKNMGRNNKAADKRLAEMDTSLKVFCVDVQAILLAPKLNVSLAYYKMKLKIHNFTSFDLTTHKGRCYLWDEVNGGLEADVFASLYVDLIKTEFERSDRNLTKIILWSDGCGYQNRNQVVSNAILDCAVKLGIIIEQKYLEHGHTFMEVDSEHSVIDRKIRKKNIFFTC
ncbi:unnamed protein product [Diatraea saccharalis]|uniref:Uncharacterized protein n=1 Tax=Diatraea saccharalis TaxID=40085 RepID=A0A9N9QZD8_9NEOP|nr:unnamed protein product [Diatraea saccharalis]